MGVLRDMAAFLLVTEPVAMELVLPLVEVWSNRLTAQIVSSLRSFSSLPVSLATPRSSIFHCSPFSQSEKLMNYIRFLMSAGAATQFHFDTVIHSSCGGSIFHKSPLCTCEYKTVPQSHIHSFMHTLDS